MIKIRTKLLIFFSIIVILLNLMAVFLYQSNESSRKQYDLWLKKFFLLNEASQNANNVNETLNAYLVDSSPEFYKKYQQAKNDLQKTETHLFPLIVTDENRLTAENYHNMIDTLQSDAAKTMHAYAEGNINVYPDYLTSVAEDSHFIEQTTLNLIDQQLVYYSSLYDKMNEKSRMLQLTGISVFVTVLSLTVLFAIWFASGITDPLHKLELSARRIASGDFKGPDVPLETKDELRFLTRTFNTMKHQISGLIEEIKEKHEMDRLLKEMELKSLQNQINPHFLFNTLNTISNTAFLEEADDTRTLIEATARMMRHNLKNHSDPILISEEVSVIKDYLYILEKRFGSRINYHIDADPAALDTKIPSQLIQPLIENAFSHGIEPLAEGGTIALSIKKNGQVINIVVADDGKGMDEATRLAILDGAELPGPKSKQSNGIGLHNVKRRLELHYRVTGLFDIESRPGEGTEIIITCPAAKTERVLS